MDVERCVDAADARRHVINDGLSDFGAHATGPQVGSKLS